MPDAPDAPHTPGLSGLSGMSGTPGMSGTSGPPDAPPHRCPACGADAPPLPTGPTARPEDVVRLLGQRLTAHGHMLATAESCTGGLIATLCTDVPGSSAWFAGGVVAYANAVKRDVLGVPAPLLEAHGAVSEPVVREMARGVRRLTGVRYAVAVSGIAGPDGGSPDKPVGTVWMALADGESVIARRFLFPGDRSDVRLATALAALHELLELCPPPPGASTSGNATGASAPGNTAGADATDNTADATRRAPEAAVHGRPCGTDTGANTP